MKGKYIVIFVCFICLNSCSNKDEHNHADETEVLIHEVENPGEVVLTQKQFDASGFKVGNFEYRSFASILNVNGMIELPDRNKAMVTTYFGGVVEGMHLIHGQWVKKGQHLFSLTNPELIGLQEMYLELNDVLPFLQSEYERLKKLSSENISPKREYLKADSEFKVAKTKLAALRTKIELFGLNPESISIHSLVSSTKVVAPISGYLSEINVIQGSYLEAKEGAMEISNTNHLHMELKVVEGDVSKLEREQKVKFNIQGNSSKTYNASIHLIERLVDENRVVNVHCHLEDDGSRSLVPGMFVNAVVELEKRESLAVPEEAIVVKDAHAHLLIQDKDDHLTYKIQEVEVGETNEGYIELLNLDATYVNAKIMIDGAYFLLKDESAGGHSH